MQSEQKSDLKAFLYSTWYNYQSFLISAMFVWVWTEDIQEHIYRYSGPITK